MTSPVLAPCTPASPSASAFCSLAYTVSIVFLLREGEAPQVRLVAVSGERMWQHLAACLLIEKHTMPDRMLSLAIVTQVLRLVGIVMAGSNRQMLGRLTRRTWR